MNHIKKNEGSLPRNFFDAENGQGMVEYGLIIALVAVAVIVAITALGGSIRNIFNKTASKLNAVSNT